MNTREYLNEMFEDSGSICWTEVSCKNMGQQEPRSLLRVAGARSRRSRGLPRLTDNQVQLGLRSNGVVAQSVPICRDTTTNMSRGDS